MKFWTATTLLIVSLLLLSGCVSSQPTPSENVVIDSTLPVVSLTKNGTMVDMKMVAFEWKAIRDPRVQGIYIYKKSPATSEDEVSELKYYDTIANRFTTHYVDTDVEPDTKYTYAFKTFSEDAQSAQSKLMQVNSLPVLQSVSWIHSITGMPRTAKIIWRPHVNKKVETYIMERKTLEDEEWAEISRSTGRLNAEFIDTDLNDNYVYMYRIRVVTFDGITSTPSEIVKVITKALPLSITNIKTTTNLPNLIKLTWNLSKQKDFKRYYVYRSENIDGRYDLVAKLFNNTFEDKIEENGKSYFYRISAVDKDGLESEHEKRSIQGMTLAQPLSPAIVEAQLLNNKIVLRWSKTDPRSVSYIVTKRHKQGWFDENSEAIKEIKAKRFIDTKIVADSTYTYTVRAVDKNGIISEASMEAQVITPESTELQNAPQVEEMIQETAKTVDVKKPTVIAPSEDLDMSGL